MAKQEMLLDTATIKAAVAGEKWAKDKVIEHYTPMIDELAVDEDMKQHLNRLDGLALVDGLHMEIDDNAVFRVEKVGQHFVRQLRGQDV